MTKFKGFTLSEVLIAMLVLGIIVSASVPVILKLAPNKNVAMIKKAYYTTETVVNGLINDQYYYPDSSIHCQGGQASGGCDPHGSEVRHEHQDGYRRAVRHVRGDHRHAGASRI